MADKVTGPASYFPSIEKTYGKPIDQWKTEMRATGLTSHKELVAWLKDQGMGHGHASALTSHLLAEGTERLSGNEQIDSLFPAKKAHWRPTYDQLAAAITAFGDVKVLPKKTIVGFGTSRQFVMLQPSTADRFDVGLRLDGVAPAGRLEAAGSWNTMMTHRVKLTDPAQVDAELIGWLRQAYDATA